MDGASANQTFFHIMLPLALPGLAMTALLGFMVGWQEFVLSWQFITNPNGSHSPCPVRDDRASTRPTRPGRSLPP